MSKLKHLPINLFAAVMGLAGLSLAWLKASHEGWLIAQPIGLAVGAATTSLLILLLLAYSAKALTQWDAVRQEAKHPVKLNFFAAIPIGLILVATIWSTIWTSLANIVWIVGSITMLGATLMTMRSWINHTHYQVGHLNPAWFIPVVGNILIPIAGVRLGYLQVSWFFFSVGLVFWLILTTIVMNRLIFHEALPARLKPTLFILLAPPAVGFLSYVNLVNGQLDTMARLLYFAALFFAMLLASNALSFLKLPFFISAWAYSFPIAAMSVASFEMGQLSGLFGYTALAWALLAALNIIVLYLIFKTLIALVSGNLLAPEPAN